VLGSSFIFGGYLGIETATAVSIVDKITTAVARPGKKQAALA